MAIKLLSFRINWMIVKPVKLRSMLQILEDLLIFDTSWHWKNIRQIVCLHLGCMVVYAFNYCFIFIYLLFSVIRAIDKKIPKGKTTILCSIY